MWLTVIGIVAGIVVLIVVLGTVGLRALRRFVRSVWPHS
jgi:hypothetical protein